MKIVIERQTFRSGLGKGTMDVQLEAHINHHFKHRVEHFMSVQQTGEGVNPDTNQVEWMECVIVWQTR